MSDFSDLVLLPDWRDRLSARAAEQEGRQPAWGTDDCMTWAADCILAMTGIDTLHAARGKYKTPRGALGVLRRTYGVQLPVELMDQLWGPRVHISQAQLGDIVAGSVGEPGMGPAAGVCWGRRSLFVGVDAGLPGLVRVETLSLEHCYQPCRSSLRQSSRSSRP